ncbi:NADPH-dependent F420 reductase [Streptomyces olivochromogenes]|uniref:NADP oxidoreductase n=1 Tax=Streptomyces olivochromogenes TaxID=1963 RepID=A0A250VVS7_STROL|nr:NAD(P)-binding domain-containing protein [Streptomyces olivochromogenes]KUN41352.1 NADP oxidoreductase [Streptomyces olivochromogenes]GAX58179.1 NADP oxidoreductase [Streptomyces olivochromogenes]
MAVIGFIGSGNIGQALARQAIASGHDVVMSNSRGPHTLTRLIDALGPSARAAIPEQAGAAGDLVVVAIPFRNVLQIPVQPLAGKIVIDANNYFAPRDGQVPAIDNADTAASEILAAHLTARVVKAFNAIMAAHIIEHARPPGTPHRRAIPIAGDDDQAKRAVTEFIDQIGFDVVDAGPLVDGRSIDPMDAWGPVLDADALRAAMASRTQR